MAITVYDTITYSRNVLMDDPVPELLQERYFPTDPTFDVFQTTDVVLDYMDVDLQSGAFVKKGYINGDTTQFRASQVSPPRIGISDTVDPDNTDRKPFEQLLYPQGDVQPTRADALNQLIRIKATRLVNRAQRRIECMISSILMNNGLSGTIPTSPSDDTPVDVSISYAPEAGNDQRFKPAHAWGTDGATPYDDVCAMIDHLQAHGGSGEDLLLSPEAWQLLRRDEAFKDRFSLPSNQYEGELFAKDIRDAKHVGIGDFGGFLLNIIVYYRKYKDESGTMQPILPKGFVCVLRPNVGRTLCGGSVKINRAMIPTDGIESSFVQRMGKFILLKKIIGEGSLNEDDSIAVCLESRPLPAPYAPWQWITMDAMNTNNLSSGTQGVYSNLDLYGVNGSKYDSANLPIKDWAKNVGVGDSVNFDTTKATLTGYTFDKIEDDDGNALTISDGKFTNPGSTSGVNVLFKSVVTFNNNTGSGSMTALSVPFGETKQLPECTFTKSSNTFVGWSTSASGDVEYLDEDIIEPEGNVTLYAVWEAD